VNGSFHHSDISALQAEHPEFTISTAEHVLGGIEYTARRIDSRQAGLYLLVTHDLAELRAALEADATR
jgi:hypothetical protein